MNYDEKYAYPSDEQIKAAVKIQSLFRGYAYRLDQSRVDLQNGAARKIQKTFREHRDRQVVQRVKEILALYRINRAAQRYIHKLRAKKSYEKLQQFEQVLNFFPSKSNAPPPPKTGRVVRKKPPSHSTMTLEKKPKLVNSSSFRGSMKLSKGLKRSIATPMQIPDNAPKFGEKGSIKINTAISRPHKKRILIELPPPWHGKDTRRLSQTQQDELMFSQKADVAWVRQDLIPQFMKYCNPYLDERDELLSKNEKFLSRQVGKSFFYTLNRQLKSLTMKGINEVKFLQNTGVIEVVSTSLYAKLEISAFTDDRIIERSEYDIKSSLIDVIIHPQSGVIVGIDSHWVLRLFHGSKTVLTYPLEVTTQVPKVQKYLYFDSFGMLWVNLFPQKGNLYLFDPVTLSPSIQINLDNLSAIHHNMRTNTYLLPITRKGNPFGFAGTFSDSTDIYIFNHDFSVGKDFCHPEFTSTPLIKQINERLFVWSSNKVLYIYEIGEYVAATKCIKTIKFHESITDICGVSDPDIFFISFSDRYVRCYLGEGSSFSLRISKNRLSNHELSFMERLLGPQKYTQSRSSFTEMCSFQLISAPVKIDAIAFSKHMILLTCVFLIGSVTNTWIINDVKQVELKNFDSFNTPLDSGEIQKTSNALYNEMAPQIQNSRSSLFETFNFMQDFGNASQKGLAEQAFKMVPEPFSLIDLMNKHSIHSLFQFIPETPKLQLSAYEAYHFLQRSGSISTRIKNFSDFLEAFAPDSEKRALPTFEGITNTKLPVTTSGLYNSIVNIVFTEADLKKILRISDPIFNLRVLFGDQTLSSCVDPDRSNTPRKWLTKFQRSQLQLRISKLSLLEDAIKHEQLQRTQNLLSLDIKKSYPSKSMKIHFDSFDTKVSLLNYSQDDIDYSDQPNRNFLLDEKHHVSIYETWSKYTLYGRDMNLQTDLRAYHIPSNYFNNEVNDHVVMVRKLSLQIKKSSSYIHSLQTIDDPSISRLVVTEDPRALPLTHYLTMNSFLGGNVKLINTLRTIFTKILMILGELHSENYIVRTLCPENIMLNASTGAVTIGNFFDAQKLSTQIASKASSGFSSTMPSKKTMNILNESNENSSVFLPLSKSFTDPSNPFLPPEFFHEPMNNYTSAFDVWQFGILLLYVTTGFLPTSYGTELLKHLTNEQIMEINAQKQKEEVNNEVPEHQKSSIIYPKCDFFYDWLAGSKIVSFSERFCGDRGECYIQTDDGNNLTATVMNLSNYHLYPGKSQRPDFDETRLLIEVIAGCLEVNPLKRMKVSDILRCSLFSQLPPPTGANGQTELLASYMRKPDPNVFISQFFIPALSHLSDASIQFSISIISALLFLGERKDEDMPYSFPLDNKSAESVTKALFKEKFIDRIVEFVLNNVSKRISYTDVNPTVSFNDEPFEALLHFFNRFINSVEKTQGIIVNNIDEVIGALFGLFCANPYMRFTSRDLIASEHTAAIMAQQESAPLSVYCYTKTHSIVRYALQGSTMIQTSIKRFSEHNDHYWEQFLNFGDTVYTLSRSMCFSIEKQRANAIKVLASVWQNGTQKTTVRLFLDFRVIQKISHCFFTSSCRNDSASFFCTAFRAFKNKPFDPTYLLLKQTLTTPTILLHCAIGIRPQSLTLANQVVSVSANSGSPGQSQNEMLRQPAIEIIRGVIFNESKNAVSDLVVTDILFTLIDQCKESVFVSLVTEVLQSSIFVRQIIAASSLLQKTLKMNEFEWVPHIDMKNLTDQSMMNLSSIISYTKQLTASIIIRVPDLVSNLVGPSTEYFQQLQAIPFDKISEYIMRCLTSIKTEFSNVAEHTDGAKKQKYNALSLNSTALLAASMLSKKEHHEKDINWSEIKIFLYEYTEVVRSLFLSLCYIWQLPNIQFPTTLFKHLISELTENIPECQTLCNPLTYLSSAIMDMLTTAVSIIPSGTPNSDVLNLLPESFAKRIHMDQAFLHHCLDKDIFGIQLMARYSTERNRRMRLLRMLLQKGYNIEPVLKVIVDEMIPKAIECNINTSLELTQNLHYPMRQEGIDMAMEVFNERRENNSSNVKKSQNGSTTDSHSKESQSNNDNRFQMAMKLAQMLQEKNFWEIEQKLINNDNSTQLSRSSIAFLKGILDNSDLFSENAIRKVRSLYESLEGRFVREWNQPPPKLQIKSATPKPRMKKVNSGSSSVRASWNYSKLQITSNSPSKKLTKASGVIARTSRPRTSLSVLLTTPK